MLGAVMVGSGNPPAVIVQVIIGCVTAKAGLWHRELRLPVFFCALYGKSLHIFLHFPDLPLERPEQMVYNRAVYL